MKVKELIAQLQNLEQNQDIWFLRTDEEDGEEHWDNIAIGIEITRVEDNKGNMITRKDYTIESVKY